MRTENKTVKSKDYRKLEHCVNHFNFHLMTLAAAIDFTRSQFALN